MTTPSAFKTVHITITSDLLCPWCWVGLKKLQEASKEANVKPVIAWKPFFLRPFAPLEGIPKGGSPESRVPSHLKQAGESVGIDFTGLTDRTPNTEIFHATMKFLQDDDTVDPKSVTEFQEMAFMGYFTLGIYPDKDGLLFAAKKVSDPEVFTKVTTLYEDENKLSLMRQQVADEAAEASRAGISGVPTFWFGGQPLFSGAQPTSTFVRYLNKYANEQ